MLERAMATAAGRGGRAMFLGVAAGNAAALRLYDAAGFAEVGRRAGYYRGGADALVLRRGLTPCGAAGG